MVQDTLDFGHSREIVPNRFDALRVNHLKKAEKDSVVALALKVIEGRFQRGQTLSDANAVKAFLQLKISEYKSEVFAALFLDSQHQLIEYQEVFQGTIDQCSVYPREVARRALELNAAATILAHQHPSGDPEPSQADIHITQQIKKVMELIDVRVLDHVVVSQTDTVSFAERGLI